MKTKNPSFSEFKRELESNTELQEKFKTNPLDAIGEFQVTPANDKFVYRTVVVVLGVICLSIILSVVVMMFTSEESTINDSIPTMLTATASAALGALTGLLAPSPD